MEDDPRRARLVTALTAAEKILTPLPVPKLDASMPDIDGPRKKHLSGKRLLAALTLIVVFAVGGFLAFRFSGA